MRRCNRLAAISAVFFGVGILLTFLFPPCVVIVISAVVIIVLGILSMKC